MTREEHLKFCKKCTKRKMDEQQGTICSITNKIADFEDTCENFQHDESVVDSTEAGSKSTFEIMSELPDELSNKLAPHQDLVYATVGGLFLSVICGLLWAIITVTTEYQIGYMAIGVGFVVGMGVRYFGAGIDPIFGYVGGFFALLGCLLGNLFSQVGFIAQEQRLAYFETLTFLDLETIILIYKETFSVMDLLFYGIAIFEGYKFAFRPIPENINSLSDLTPEFSKFRLPLVITCFLVLSISGYVLSKGASGDQVFYYESGSVKSRGELVNGKENGLWNYFYENGQTQTVAKYIDGVENGLWEWYYESGPLMKSGHYKNGLLHDSWLNYNENGILVDSSNYSLGRLHGSHKSYYDNGSVFQIGQYERDRQTGEWKIYSDNGNLSAAGTFKNGEFSGIWKFMYYDGNPYQEVDYQGGKVIKIMNVWDLQGKQIVKDGDGMFVSYFDINSKEQEGRVNDGIKVGMWTTYYVDGKVKEVGEFKDNQYIIKSAWDEQGAVMVENGNGEYITSFENSSNEFEHGNFKNGLRDGTWVVYYPNTTVVQQESVYKNGKLNGPSVGYYANGNVLTEGTFENDKKIGEWKWYYEFGQLQCTVNYKDDKKQGIQIFWSESGREAKQEVYDNGEFISESLL